MLRPRSTSARVGRPTQRCAPTEHDSDGGTHLQGTVHDYSARLLGGVCGAAGVFTTFQDLARFLRHLLPPGPDPARTGFGPAWVTECLPVHTSDLNKPRGLFWHPPSSTDPRDGIYAHYGFTGTAMWLSAKQHRWAVLLTNKLYYSRDRLSLKQIRNAFCAIVYGCSCTRTGAMWSSRPIADRGRPNKQSVKA